MCEVMGDPQVERKFDTQAIQLDNSPRFKADTTWLVKANNVVVITAYSNMTYFFQVEH